MTSTAAPQVTSKDILKAHPARWFVYTAPQGDPGRELIPWQNTMRGFWPGYEVTCKCGWKTQTGGATRTSVRGELDGHRDIELWNANHPDQKIAQ